MPLQHHLARWIRGIQVHVRVERIAEPDGKGRGHSREDVLMHPGRQRRLVRHRAGERRRVAARPVPILADAGRHRPRRHRIVDPGRGRRRPGLNPCAVPGGAAVVQHEAHPAHRQALEADLRGRDLEAHPLSGRRQRPHVAPARRAIDTPADEVGAPVRTMLKRGAVVPLQHHLARWIRGIQVHVRVERIAEPDGKGRGRSREDVLMHPGRQRRLVRQPCRRTAPGCCSSSSNPRRCRPAPPPPAPHRRPRPPPGPTRSRPGQGPRSSNPHSRRRRRSSPRRCGCRPRDRSPCSLPS